MPVSNMGSLTSSLLLIHVKNYNQIVFVISPLREFKIKLMFRVGIAVTLSLLLIFSLQGQYPGKKPAYISLYDRAEKLFSSQTADETSDSIALAGYQEVIRILQDSRGNKGLLADCYFKSGILLMTAQNLEEAISSFRMDISTVSQSQLPDSLLFKPYLYAGSIHYDLNNPDSALFFYKKAEAIKDNTIPSKNRKDYTINWVSCIMKPATIIKAYTILKKHWPW